MFSRARNGGFRDHNIFCQVFERIVGACIAAGLVGGDGFAVDASLIEADANKSRSVRAWNGTRIDIRKQPAGPPRNIGLRWRCSAYGRPFRSRRVHIRRRTAAAQWTAR